jgi:hypothetical protein
MVMATSAAIHQPLEIARDTLLFGGNADEGHHRNLLRARSDDVGRRCRDVERSPRAGVAARGSQ